MQIGYSICYFFGLFLLTSLMALKTVHQSEDVAMAPGTFANLADRWGRTCDVMEKPITS